MMQNGYGLLQMRQGSSFVPRTYVLATVLANCKPGNRRDLWKDHRSTFITAICNRFKKHWEPFSNGWDALGYALLDFKYYLCDMVTAPFLTLVSLECIMTQHPLQSSHNNKLRGTTFVTRYTLQFHPSSQNSNASLTKFLMHLCLVYPILPLSTLSLQHLQLFINENSKYVTLLPSSFESHSFSLSSQSFSLSSSLLLLLDVPDGTGKPFVLTSIQGFLQLWGKYFLPLRSQQWPLNSFKEDKLNIPPSNIRFRAMSPISVISQPKFS